MKTAEVLTEEEEETERSKLRFGSSKALIQQYLILCNKSALYVFVEVDKISLGMETEENLFWFNQCNDRISSTS